MRNKITDFTFGVVTYNSDSTIIETLESIKYQIENFGTGIKFNLIISDDCSKDSTNFFVNEWIKINKPLFVETKILTTSVNSGLCVNYAQLINNIKTNYFIQIAGDDLLCSRNVFKSMEDLGKDELRVYLPIIYNGERIEISDSDIARQLFYKDYKHTNKKDIHILETMTPYCSSEIIFLKKFYTLDSMEYIKQFRNFEDDTSLYYILRNNKETIFSFRMDPFIIYRKAGNSLTTSVDNANQIKFMDDLYRFRRCILKDEKHVPTKLFMVLSVWHHFLMKHRFDASKSLYKKTKDYIEKRRIKAGKKNPEFMDYKKKIELFIQDETQYLEQLKANSIAFLKRMNMYNE